jgi:hypothetical protein
MTVTPAPAPKGDTTATMQVPAASPYSPRSPLPESRVGGGSRFWALTGDSSEDEDLGEDSMVLEQESLPRSGPLPTTFGDFQAPAWKKLPTYESGGGCPEFIRPGGRCSRFGRSWGREEPRSRVAWKRFCEGEESASSTDRLQPHSLDSGHACGGPAGGHSIALTIARARWHEGEDGPRGNWVGRPSNGQP